MTNPQSYEPNTLGTVQQPLSIPQLGAITFFHQHPLLLYKEFPDGIIKWEADVCTRTKQSASQLHEYGHQALVAGASSIRLSYTLIRAPSYIAYLEGFPNIKIKSAHRVDGTIPSSDTDEEMRYLAGPPWADNSCAIDSALVAMIILNVGRCQADQALMEFDESTKAARALYQVATAIVRKPWGLLTHAHKSSLRNVLHKAYASSIQSQVGTYMSISAVWEDLTWGAAQFRATWLLALRCCPGGSWSLRSTADGSLFYRRIHGIFAETPLVSSMCGLSFNEQIQLPLGVTESDKSIQRTIRCSTCSKDKEPTTERLHIVADRPPPSLSLTQWQGDFIDGMFEPLTLTFTCWDDGKFVEISTQYVCRAAVFRLGHAHFVTVANLRAGLPGDPDFIYYDGMKKRGTTTRRKEDFRGMLNKGDQVSILIYVRVA